MEIPEALPNGGHLSQLHPPAIQEGHRTQINLERLPLVLRNLPLLLHQPQATQHQPYIILYQDDTMG